MLSRPHLVWHSSRRPATAGAAKACHPDSAFPLPWSYLGVEVDIRDDLVPRGINDDIVPGVAAIGVGEEPVPATAAGLDVRAAVVLDRAAVREVIGVEAGGEPRVALLRRHPEDVLDAGGVVVPGGPLLHDGLQGRVIRVVPRGPADEDVLSAAGDEDVVAGAADEQVAAGAADQDVIPAATDTVKFFLGGKPTYQGVLE